MSGLDLIVCTCARCRRTCLSLRNLRHHREAEVNKAFIRQFERNPLWIGQRVRERPYCVECANGGTA